MKREDNDSNAAHVDRSGPAGFEPGQLLHKRCVGVDYLWHELDAEVKAIWSTAEANLLNELTTTMRNRFAKEMLAHGFSTGHGDTVEDLLHELWDQIERTCNEPNPDSPTRFPPGNPACRAPGLHAGAVPALAGKMQEPATAGPAQNAGAAAPLSRPPGRQEGGGHPPRKAGRP